MINEECKQAERNLIDSFARWDHLYVYGGQDPFWADGCNLNLLRNHILHYRKELEKLEYFPEIYSKDVPPEVDNDYMAREDEIRKHARQSFVAYLEDENYLYLLKNSGQIDRRTAEEISIANVLGYVKGLKKFIAEDDLVSMRRHERKESYMESFKKCREKLERILGEKKDKEMYQMDIFDFITT